MSTITSPSQSSDSSSSSSSPSPSHLSPPSSFPSTPHTPHDLFDAFTPARSGSGSRSRSLSPISQQSQNDQQEEIQDEEIHLRSLQARKKKLLQELHNPQRKSTKTTYSRCQSDFRAWCRSSNVSELVDETKLLLFLHSQHRRNHKKNRGKIIGYQALRQYSTAIVNLWETQKRQGLVFSENPRTHNVRNWLRSTALSEQDRKRFNFEDRASQLHLESTITVKERESLSLHFLRKKKFGMRFAWIGAYSQMLRGESIRGLEFADLLLKDHEPATNQDPASRESTSAIKMLICVLGQGKTHRDGQTQFGACYRAKDPLLCPIGSLALYFFSRFQVDDEEDDPFPDLTEPKAFFNIKVVRARPSHNQRIDPQKGISYNSHYRAFKRAYAAVGIDSSKATHLCRSGSASTVAQDQDVSHEDVRLAGRWDYSVMVQNYLHKIPHKVLGSLAGFKAEVGSVKWARDIEPPEDLQKQVFPFLDHYRIDDVDDDVEDSEDGRSDSETNSDDDDDDDDRIQPGRIKLANQTSIRLVKLFRYLRLVLLQDAAILQEKCPNLSLLGHDIFKSDSFLHFQEQVLRAQRCSERTTSQAIEDLDLSTLQHSNSAILQEVREMREEIRALSTSTLPLMDIRKPTLTQLKSVPELWKVWTKGSATIPSVEELDSKNQGRTGWMTDGYRSGKQTVSSKTWRRRYSRMKEIITPIKRRVEESGEKRKRVVKKMEKIRGDWSLNKLSNLIGSLRKRNEEFSWTRTQLENLR